MQIAQLVATSGADLMSMLPFLQVEAAQTAEIAGAEDFSVNLSMCGTSIKLAL